MPHQRQFLKSGFASGIVHHDPGLVLDASMATPHVLTASGNDDTPNTPEILSSIVNMQSGPFLDFRRADPNSSASATYASLIPPGSSRSSHDLHLFSDYHEYHEDPSDDYKPNHHFELRVREELSDLPTDGANIHQAENNFTDDSNPGNVKSEDMTEEERTRRLRRRERNKLAATKCRNKKKIKSQQLMKESEELESQNQILKSEIQKLEYEKRHLMEVLTSHDPALAQRLKASSVTLNASKSDAGTHFYQTTGSVPGTTRDQYDKTILPQLLSIVKLLEEPPSFSEALRMANLQDGLQSIKVETEDEFSRPQFNYYPDGSIY